MKVAIITLLFATLALANPAPVAAPEAAAVPDAVAQPTDIEARKPVDDIAAARLQARFAGIMLESRQSKGSKGKTGSSGKSNTTGDAAGMISPSRALQIGALGLGVVEVVRLWG